MKDHKVVAMPMPADLERRVNVAEFILSQESKQPPSLRRPVTRGRQTKNNRHNSNSPRRKRLSNSRDLVQEVYDRMGVNYVRGQKSAEIYDSNGSFSTNSEVSKLSNSKPSNVSRSQGVSTNISTKPSTSSRTPGQYLCVDTRDEVNDDDRDEGITVRSTRSVKSLMSKFGGGKSVASAKSVASRNSFEVLDYVNATPAEGVSEKIIDCRNDNDMDGTMSIISLDESQWTNRNQQQPQEEEKLRASRSSDSRSHRASFQTSTASSNVKGSVVAKSTYSANAILKASSARSSVVDNLSVPTGLRDETIDKLIEEKLKAKFAELNSIFEEKFHRLEENTNRRLEKIEMQLTEYL